MHYIYFIVSTLINIIIVFILILGSKNYDSYLSFVVLLLLIINIISFFIYNDMIDLFEREHVNSQIRNKYELIKMQTDNINESTRELRKLEHDLKNKLTPIAYLVKEEKLDQLNRHFESILDDFSKVSIFKESGILELDGLLNAKYNKGKKLGIDFESYISISDKLNVNGMDLAVVMGNLLDNAIEATSKVANRWIKFSIKEVHGVLFISVENSYDGILNIKNNEFLTRKEDKKLHGIGLRNVKTIIEKYDGDLDIKYNYNTFKAIIILYEIY